MATTLELLRVAHHICRHLPERQNLAALAARASQSVFGLQRGFTRMAGESPARYARRLRALQAAARLLSGDAPLQQVAHRSGFSGTEVLIRSFRAEYGCTPGEFRRRLRPRSRDPRFLQGLKRLTQVAPCIGLYHMPLTEPRRPDNMTMLSVALRKLEPQPSLIIRSRVPRSEIAATIGQSLGRIVPYAMSHGGALAGQPFSRYPEFGPGIITLEAGMPLAAPVAGEGDIEAFTLPGGLAAVAVHAGAYEKMPDTYTALERWIQEQGHAPADAPWEVYVTDPAQHPDPADWRTEIYWPVR